MESRTNQVLPFPKRGRGAAPGPAPSHVPPAEDIGKYERPQDEADDFRHRMLVNIASFGFLAVLVVAGLWLAIRIADMRKDQDCVLSGRRNCANVVVQPGPQTGPTR